MKKYSISNKKGFTIIETLVAVAIMMVAVAGPLAAASHALATAQTSRDELTSAYLAQDAMEYVHSLRDANLVFGSVSSGGIESCLDTGGGLGGCTIDTTRDVSSSLTNPANNSNDMLYIDNITGLYTHSPLTGGTANALSFYRRRIYIAPTANEDTIKVTVWYSNGKPNGSSKFELIENLLNQ